MKKILVFLCAVITCTVFAETKNITWKVGGATYATSTCEMGGDLIIPQTNPTKYGYHFVGWNNYTFLEYIESTGTQWIDTGVVPNESTKIEIHGIQGRSDSALFGVAKMFYVFTNTPNDTHYNFIGDLQHSPLNFNLQGLDANIIMSGTDGIIINGVKMTSLTPGTVTTTYSIILFGRMQSETGIVGKLGNHRIYSCKLWEGSALVRDFVPARRNSDGVIGMYDTVSGRFFTNAGTGTFIAGPVKQ